MLSLLPIIVVLNAQFAVPGFYTPDGEMRMLGSSSDENPVVIFATYAETAEQLRGAVHLAESVRGFAGRYSGSSIRVYVPDDIGIPMPEIEQLLSPWSVEVRVSHTPEAADWLYYAGKTYAAGLAEKEAENQAAILVWMDDDTVILQEPASFGLDAKVSLAYRPVMHNRSGSLYDKPADAFWQRIYDDLKISDEKLFPMITPADGQTIRAYFNAGLLVVRPEKGVLRKWGRDFATLYQDSALADICKRDVDKRIFLHQTALVGAVLNTLGRDEIAELPESYNYPLFFHRMFEAAKEFESIDGIVTMRYDVYFRDPDPQWSKKLKGPSDKITWLAERLGREASQ